MCQVTVVSPLLFRRHGTERPTWPRRAALDLLRRGGGGGTFLGALAGTVSRPRSPGARDEGPRILKSSETPRVGPSRRNDKGRNRLTPLARWPNRGSPCSA